MNNKISTTTTIEVDGCTSNDRLHSQAKLPYFIWLLITYHERYPMRRHIPVHFASTPRWILVWRLHDDYYGLRLDFNSSPKTLVYILPIPSHMPSVDVALVLLQRLSIWSLPLVKCWIGVRAARDGRGGLDSSAGNVLYDMSVMPPESVVYLVDSFRS